MIPDDLASIFSYDGEGDPDTFSLHELNEVVSSHFGPVCTLEKLAEGGYHKVYNILKSGSSLGVVRVAAPAFPKDKLESEVATLKYLKEHTRIPVPKVYAWNSDASNPVGAEYMIMQKVPGAPASEKWGSLSTTIKERVVSQVADHLMAMFSLRFDRAGSLYLSPTSESSFIVGPIVSLPFYRAIDGCVRVPDGETSSYTSELFRLRGPFSNTSDYLQSFLRAELLFLSHHHSIASSELDLEDEQVAISRIKQGERVLQKAVQLCSIYPGDIQIHDQANTSKKLFSLRLDDFRLSNIMIDESGQVTGIIDFEGTTIAPLWECALLPRWLQDPDDPESSHEGGSAESRQALRALFLEKVGDREWKAFYEKGKPFRLLCDRLHFQIGVWASKDLEAWVDERLAWAPNHPGVGFPECNQTGYMPPLHLAEPSD